MIVCFKKKHVCSVKPQRRRSRDGQNSFLNGNRCFVFKRKKTIFFSFSFLNVKEFISFFSKRFFQTLSVLKISKRSRKKFVWKKTFRLKAKRFPKWTLRRENDRFVKKQKTMPMRQDGETAVYLFEQNSSCLDFMLKGNVDVILSDPYNKGHVRFTATLYLINDNENIISQFHLLILIRQNFKGYCCESEML